MHKPNRSPAARLLCCINRTCLTQLKPQRRRHPADSNQHLVKVPHPARSPHTSHAWSHSVAHTQVVHCASRRLRQCKVDFSPHKQHNTVPPPEGTHPNQSEGCRSSCTKANHCHQGGCAACGCAAQSIVQLPTMLCVCMGAGSRRHTDQHKNTHSMKGSKVANSLRAAVGAAVRLNTAPMLAPAAFLKPAPDQSQDRLLHYHSSPSGEKNPMFLKYASKFKRVQRPTP
jgi:hypothetical protein